jgi:hypothetical protein
MNHRLKTSLMGFIYADDGLEGDYNEEYNDKDLQIDKWAQTNPDYVDEFILTRKKKDGAAKEGGSTSQLNPEGASATKKIEPK